MQARRIYLAARMLSTKSTGLPQNYPSPVWTAGSIYRPPAIIFRVRKNHGVLKLRVHGRREENPENNGPFRDSLMISKLHLPGQYVGRRQGHLPEASRFTHLRSKRDGQWEDANISSAALHQLSGQHDAAPVKQS